VKLKRLLIVVFVGALLVCGAGFYLYFWQSRLVGSGPAGPVVSHAAFAKSWTDREVLLVGLGDSVTTGYGARKGHSYFDLLVTNPPDEFDEMRGNCLSAFLPKLRFTNLSVSGSTSAEHAERQIPELPDASSNSLAIIVMTTGGNDLIHNYGRTPPRDQAMYGATLEEAKPWIDEFAKRLKSEVEEIKSHFPGGCEIFIADIYDPTDGKGDIERTGLPAWPDGPKLLAAYNDVIHQTARDNLHVHLVGLHDAFLGHGIHCSQLWSGHYDSHDPHYWYYINLEDPNERGYDAIRRLFLIEIGKVMRQPE
jgi:lysophospholipase L1-like esterase